MAESHHADPGFSSGTAGGLIGRPLQCIVVSPEATVLEESADFVVLPLDDGEIGIGPGHTPLIGRLGYGELRLVKNGQSKRFYVDGGFVQVAANVVSVLTSRAVPAEAIDPQVAAEQLATATSRPAHTVEEMAHRDQQQRQARAQLHIARKR